MDEPYNNLRDFKSEVEAFKVENDNLKRDYEKTTLDYEMKIGHLIEENNLKSVNYQNLSINFQELDAKYKTLSQEKIEISQSYFDLSQEKLNIVRKFDSLELEHTSLLELIAKREKDILNNKEEIQELKSQLMEFNNKEIEMKLNQNDIEYRRKDFEKLEELSAARNKILVEEIKSLEARLLECKKENFDEKSKHNKIIYDLNLDLETKRNEIKNLKRIQEKMNEKIVYLEKSNAEQNESLRSVVENQTNVDNLLRKELNVQKSINELYKEEREEFTTKESNFINAISELQESLKETYDESEKIKKEYESKLTIFSTQLSELRQEIITKEKELNNANDLLEKFRVKSLSEEEMRSMNPATASAISALKRGYSMTQIYSEYVQVVNERDELKVDRDRLNQYMMSVLEELEQKKPLFAKQQKENADLEMAVSMLGKNYSDNQTYLLNCQSELNDYRSKCDDLTKKLKREEQTCADLSQQVCYLIREIETYRGTVIRSDIQANADEPEFIRRMKNFNQRGLMHQSHSSIGTHSLESSGRYLTSKDVITKHLVTFKDICELQKQNMQLIQQLRDLSEQQESTENLINENSVQDLAKKLEIAYREMEEIKIKQMENKQLHKTIDDQKLVIQALTVLSDKSDLALVLAGSSESLNDKVSHIGDGPVDTRFSNQSSVISSLNGKLSEAQDKIEKLHSEIAQLLNEKSDLKEAHANITEELNKQIADTKIINAGLLTKISFNQEKSSSLEQNLINRQLEQSDLQNELSEVNQQLSKKTEEVKNANEELLSCQSQVKHLESELRRLQQNMKHIESLEEQIRVEKSEKYQLMLNLNNMASQIGNFQAILTKPQPEDTSEEKIELKARVKQLTLELKQERSKYQNALELWQGQLSECNGKIDSLTAQLNQNTIMTHNVAISEFGTPGILQNTPEKREKTSDLESQLEDLTVANQSLTKQLESYQEFFENSESKLISNAQLNEEMKVQFQNMIDEERKKSTDTRDKMQVLQSAYDQIEIEYNNVKKDLEDKIDELTKNLNEYHDTIENLNSEIVHLKETQVQLKNDFERQRILTKEANENYQQELIYHSQESDALQEMSEEMNRLRRSERDLSEKLQETILLRDQYQVELEQFNTGRLEDKQKWEAEITELRKQKDSLNNRLIDLNDTLINFKKIIDPSLETGIDHAVIQRESDWNEVIIYLRQEKETAEKLKNQFEMDSNRYKAECIQKEEQINQLTIALEEERKFKVLEAETNKQHSEMMRKIEHGQILSESNAMLRQDRERLKEELEDKTRKFQQMQEAMEPLRSEIKLKSNEIESIKLDARSLENERDLWRKRCDALIEKSKQVNPEDFKQICMEKDQLQHQLLLEEEKCRSHMSKIEELQNDYEFHMKTINDYEEQFESLRNTNEENVQTIQKRDGLIAQLKEIGRKYRAETESQKIEIDQKDEKLREFQSVKKDLMETKISLEESKKNLEHYMNQATTSSSSHSAHNEDFMRKLSSILSCSNSPGDIYENVDRIIKDENEQKLRYQAIENHLAMVKAENERLKKLREITRPTQEDDIVPAEDNIADVQQPASTWYSVPTVARVAANIHPVVQKPQNIISGSNQISPNSQPVSSCTSTARQTAEIRPIHAVSLHLAPNNSATATALEISDNLSSASVTTSLPANVVQALAASSVPTVIFPAVTAFPSTSSSIAGSNNGVSNNANRLKRCFDDIGEPESHNIAIESTMALTSSSLEPSYAKKLRIVPESSVSISQEIPSITTDLNFREINQYAMDDMCEEEVEIESEEVENIDISEDEDVDRDTNNVDDITLEINDKIDDFFEDDNIEGDESEGDDYEDSNDEENDDEEDDEDDDLDEDDDDDNPPVIEILSSEDDDNQDDDNTQDKYDHNDGKDTSEMSHTKTDRGEPSNDEELKDSELEQAKKKIEPIVWGDNNNQWRNNAQAKQGAYSISPSKVGNSSSFVSRRKQPVARRNFGYGPNRTLSQRGASGSGQFSRRSGGPFKGNFMRR